MNRRQFTFAALALAAAPAALADHAAPGLSGRLVPTREGDLLTLQLYARNDADHVVSVLGHYGANPAGHLRVWAERAGERQPLEVVRSPLQERERMSRAGPRPRWENVEAGTEVLVCTWQVRWDGEGTLAARVSVETDAGALDVELADCP